MRCFSGVLVVSKEFHDATVTENLHLGNCWLRMVRAEIGQQYVGTFQEKCLQNFVIQYH